MQRFHVTIQVNPNAETPQVLDQPAGPLCPAIAEAKRLVAEALERGGAWRWVPPKASCSAAWAVFDPDGQLVAIIGVYPCGPVAWAECQANTSACPIPAARAAA